MNIFKNIIISIFVMACGSFFVILSPQPVSAIAGNPTCAKGFLTFPVWYRGLTKSDLNCTIEWPDPADPANNGKPIELFVGKIILNVVEAGMMAVGYIAVFFVVFGGYQFITSNGKPESAAKARSTIMNAAIGLVISFAAVAIIDFITVNILK